MDEIKILEKIIEEGGRCDWIHDRVKLICTNCPMYRLKKKPNGDYYSCVESLNVQDLSEEEANKVYEKTARRLLADKLLEKILVEEGDDKEEKDDGSDNSK